MLRFRFSFLLSSISAAQWSDDISTIDLFFLAHTTQVLLCRKIETDWNIQVYLYRWSVAVFLSYFCTRYPQLISCDFGPNLLPKGCWCTNYQLSNFARWPTCSVVASSNRNEFSKHFVLFSDMVVGNIDTPVPSVAYNSSKFACDIRIAPAMYCEPNNARISTASVVLQWRGRLYDGAFFCMNSLVRITISSIIFSLMNKFHALSNVVTPTPFLRTPESSVRIFCTWRLSLLLLDFFHFVTLSCPVKKLLLSYKGTSSSEVELLASATDWISALLSTSDRWSQTSEPSSLSTDSLSMSSSISCAIISESLTSLLVIFYKNYQ